MVIREGDLTFTWTFEAARRRFVHTKWYNRLGKSEFAIEPVSVPDMAFCLVHEKDRPVMFMAGEHDKATDKIHPLFGTHVSGLDCFICLGRHGREAVVRGVNPVTVFWATSFTRPPDKNLEFRSSDSYAKTIQELSRVETFLDKEPRTAFQIQSFFTLGTQRPALPSSNQEP